MPDNFQLTPHFHLSEFVCRHCGEVNELAARRLASRLELAREFAGPMTIVSGFRCPANNNACGGKPNSQHLLGLAVDILVISDGHRFQLVKALLDSGFKRIGIGKSIVHADIGDVPGFVLWTYYA
jgi:uncharacterized protein YcbK (DUF882 family)